VDKGRVSAGELALRQPNFQSVPPEYRSLRVYSRVRPVGTTGDNTASCVTMGDNGQLAIYNPVNDRRSIFAFDKVFAEGATQEHVYIETQPLIRSVVDGYNVCIFAYGQTGSGKTHTMSGTRVDMASGRGINYRALDDLFDLQHQRRMEVKYTIRVQMLEVYNEKARFLARLYCRNDASRPRDSRPSLPTY
jgi:kinesin family member C2/C3